MDYEAKLTDIIASLPEVSGGFLYERNRGIYSNQTAGMAGDDALQQVALKLTKIVSMLSVHFHDTDGIRVAYKDLILFGTNIKDGEWMFLLHQPSLSAGMIKMTIQMALNINTEKPPQYEPTQPLFEEVIPADNLMESLFSSESELKEPLETIQSKLALYIGPVAELVFQDSVEMWGLAAPPTLATLPELISILENEIDDENDRTAFRNELNDLSKGE